MSYFDDELDLILTGHGVEIYPADAEADNAIMITVVIDGAVDMITDVAAESDADGIVNAIAEHLRTHGLGENFDHVCVDAYERFYVKDENEPDVSGDRIAYVEYGE